MPGLSAVVKETPHFLRLWCVFSFTAWLCRSDLTCFSSALVPAERLGHFCLSVIIYNTENCWINSPAVPDLRCFSSSFEPCMSDSVSLALWVSVWVCLSLMLCLVCTFYTRLFKLQKEITEHNKKTDGWDWGNYVSQQCFSLLLIPPLPHSLTVFLTVFLSFSLSLSLHVSFISTSVPPPLNLCPTGCVTLTCPHHYSVLKQAVSVL